MATTFDTPISVRDANHVYSMRPGMSRVDAAHDVAMAELVAHGALLKLGLWSASDAAWRRYTKASAVWAILSGLKA